MKEVNVNGQNFIVLTKEEIEERLFLKEKDIIEIDYGLYLYNNFNRDKLYKSVGYKTIDYAIPQTLFDTKEVKERMECFNDRPVYYYGKYSNYGRILWDNDTLELLIDNIIRKLDNFDYTEL